MKLDDIDKRILRVLQRDGRIANNDLAREVGLSPSPCLRRVKLLEEAGVIDRYVAVLNPAKVGKGLTFFTRIRLDQQDEETLQTFAKEILKLPQVLECYFMLGDYDAMIRVVAADIEDYRRFQSEYLSRIKGVQNLKTDVPSQTVKQTSEMPL
ncbi:MULTISPECIES: Lrp/AsnC family transcriptional regulator [Brucella/Ochrobactrum group]|jgi:Lrp/AsnC family transcriptional regulator, leucine-responsive regulatory protein|uniref:Transcriptional regulator, AsnC family n=4 Tax=Brucella TaxID=234 RepID=A6X5Z6_BRUA4|nr:MULTISPECIES: Lrp/AsnC family transcriptional regulator [Brucella/Ochrobactrum group]MCR5939488.1 Lrp/AsnC family transcriptional regulator [Ochrobactrum sp. XJ1]NKC51284.1 Lrp/AsnC family transcriptional regulator [Brucella cytisi]QOD65862.1 Lrp/AsnC family transcriptional regulator [Ochrobactrum sp. MT180101]QTN04616.1 winged helix-turn-helix transcriptional regulator [Ochrobactrum sp. EEELCW01]RNL46592.1 Lrp/AsnC family transcriptional regulator [Ochrobactrum sp. MH181795]